ncbi:MAG: cell division protein FtsZ [Arachidicoccus sp.]|nr:cell division protein FtsZ [Arachidicoccus sp.]
MIDFDIPKQRSSIIKVIGVGGGGGNAVNHMFSQKIDNVDFIICNTDAQALDNSAIPNKIQLGPHLTQGLGAGANPEVGKQATQESLEEIKRILEVNTKMAFVCAGMGGGTGTGGAPIIAKICQDLGILTVGIVTTPFSFEGPRRKGQAESGIKELEPHVDTLLVISNDKLRMQHKNLKMREAFGKADDVLSTAAKCITDIINSNGQINVDFADVCTVMRKGGVAILGSATAEGDDRAQSAIEDAINSPLLNDNDISGAKWILLNINTSEGDYECGTDEFELINDFVRQKAGEHTDVIVGMGIDNSLGKGLAVTLIATGFEHKDPFEKKQKVETVPQQEKEKVILTLDDFLEPKPIVVSIKEEIKKEEPVQEDVKKTEPIQPVLEKEESLEPTIIEESPEQTVIQNITDNDVLEEENMSFVLKEDQPENISSPVQDFQYEERPEENVIQKQESLHTHTFLSKPSNIYASQPSLDPVKENNATQQPQPKISTIFPVTEEDAMEMVIKENVQTVAQHVANAINNADDLSEEELKRKKAEERIQKLRNLSYNFSNKDSDNDLENVPAYVRRNLEMLDGGNVAENYYSKYTVDKDDKKGTNISSINTFLEGKKPD